MHFKKNASSTTHRTRLDGMHVKVRRFFIKNTAFSLHVAKIVVIFLCFWCSLFSSDVFHIFIIMSIKYALYSSACWSCAITFDASVQSCTVFCVLAGVVCTLRRIHIHFSKHSRFLGVLPNSRIVHNWIRRRQQQRPKLNRFYLNLFPITLLINDHHQNTKYKIIDT